MSLHNIICLEGEWLYNKKKTTFNLKTESMLNFIKEFYDCNVIYRHILTKQDLQYYLDYFNSHKRIKNNYDIIYISCHGWFHSISLEGEDSEIDLSELTRMANGFFTNKIIHFGACKTLANTQEVESFKNESGAKLVSGYERSVDAMLSAIADTALFNELINTKNVGIIKNAETSTFRKRYKELLNELRFVAI